jgi:diguanylate cyclase (GGDEF)-like protein
MKNHAGTHTTANIPRWRRILANVWHLLIEPSPALVEPERRLQARLLMAILLVLLILDFFSLILSLFDVFTKSGEAKAVTAMSFWITLSAFLVLAVDYGLSRTIHYRLAAGLAVGTLLSATFAAVIPNPQDLRATSFLILGGLVGSLFLSVWATAIVFFITFIGLLLLPVFVPGFSASKDLNAPLLFILTVGGLVVIATSLRQRYIDQIDWQTKQLVQSEARLRELSIRDPLTGLFNRRYLEEALAIELIRAERKRSPIGIIIADIDHFKRFNDTHGHAAGDAVLAQVGNFLRTHVRASDITCRYGGEEFLLILPEAPREITQRRAEQMQEDTRQLHVQYEGQTLEAITLSLGVAVYPEHGSTSDTIIRAADDALYRAKHDGRDRVVVAE